MGWALVLGSGYMNALKGFYKAGFDKGFRSWVLVTLLEMILL